MGIRPLGKCSFNDRRPSPYPRVYQVFSTAIISLLLCREKVYQYFLERMFAIEDFVLQNFVLSRVHNFCMAYLIVPSAGFPCEKVCTLSSPFSSLFYLFIYFIAFCLFGVNLQTWLARVKEMFHYPINKTNLTRILGPLTIMSWFFVL